MTTLVPEMSLENSIELEVKLNKNHIHVHVTNDFYYNFIIYSTC